MTTNKNTPAFPRAGNEWDEMSWVPSASESGMTLRDYFAAKAMQGMQSRVNWDMVTVARLAYEQADEMLEARK